MTKTIEQLQARIERLNYSLAQETALSDRLKMASRMPGTGNYVEWIEVIRNSHGQVEQLQARVAELKAEMGGWRNQAHQSQSTYERTQEQLAASQAYGKRMRDAMQLFCDRVESGEVRSFTTYTSFKTILSDIKESEASNG